MNVNLTTNVKTTVCPKRYIVMHYSQADTHTECHQWSVDSRTMEIAVYGVWSVICYVH